MYRMVLNGAEQAGGEGCQTWGELLERLDAACAGQGRLVTAVRLDGVDVPAFRDAEARTQALSGIASVEVDASSPRDLVAATIDEAVRAALHLSEDAARIGAGFRGFDVSNANQELCDFAGTLGTLLTLARTLSEATGIALEAVYADERPASQVIGGLLGHIDALLDAQRQGDWITVADIVEYDITPALQSFPALFRALGGIRAEEAGVAPADSDHDGI